MDTEKQSLMLKRIKSGIQAMLHIEWVRSVVGGILVATGASSMLSGFFGINMGLGISYYGAMREFVLEFIVGIGMLVFGVVTWLYSDF